MNLNKKILIYLGVIALFVAVGVATVSKIASASALSVLTGRDLTVGDRGTDVADLQGILSEQGYLEVPMGVPYGYFGPLTQSALARYQASLGVVPASGYYGPVTKSRVIQAFTARGWMTILTKEII